MEKQIIPKKIHYCWFGGNPLGENEKKCILSWKKYLPDYEIIEWNENNYDVNKNTYIAQAYKKRLYAFVSDYARFDILYQHGGVYFDTDVEVIKSIDEIVKKGAFMGCEAGKRNIAVAPGLGIAAEKGNIIYKKILEYYESMSLCKEGEANNLITVVEHVTKILKNYGLKNTKKIQKVGDIFIYPAEYFCPMNQWTRELHITDNTYTIHHYSASWTSKEQKEKAEEIKRLSKYMGISMSKICVLLHYEYKHGGVKQLTSYILKKIKKYSKKIMVKK